MKLALNMCKDQSRSAGRLLRSSQLLAAYTRDLAVLFLLYHMHESKKHKHDNRNSNITCVNCTAKLVFR